MQETHNEFSSHLIQNTANITLLSTETMKNNAQESLLFYPLQPTIPYLHYCRVIIIVLLHPWVADRVARRSQSLVYSLTTVIAHSWPCLRRQKVSQMPLTWECTGWRRTCLAQGTRGDKHAQSSHNQWRGEGRLALIGVVLLSRVGFQFLLPAVDTR